MRQPISKEKAIELIKWHPVGLVDTIRNIEGKLVQSIFKDQWILDKLDKFSNTIEIAGLTSRNYGYGICLVDEVGFLFIATNKEALSKVKIIDIELTCNN